MMVHVYISQQPLLLLLLLCQYSPRLLPRS
jgi:hypothetical protein